MLSIEGGVLSIPGKVKVVSVGAEVCFVGIGGGGRLIGLFTLGCKDGPAGAGRKGGILFCCDDGGISE